MENGTERNFNIDRKLLAMITCDPSTILVVKDNYLTPQMWRIAIEAIPSIFQYMRNPSPDICAFAVNESGENLKWVVEKNPDAVTNDMCYNAIDSYPSAIFYVPSEHLDTQMKEYAFDLDPTLLKAFSDVRPEYIREKLEEDPTFCRYLPNPTEDMEYKAIEASPSYCVYVKHFTPRIKALIRTLYPEIIPMLPNYDQPEEPGF